MNFLPWLAFEKRSKNHKIPNNSKFEKSKEFISLVEQEVKSNRLSSIDETINYLKASSARYYKEYGDCVY